MDAAIYICPRDWIPWLPDDTARPGTAPELAERIWDLLVLTPEACPKGLQARCRVLLAPGDRPDALAAIQAESVVSYGLSLRDSLTLSSFTEPLLCLQRAVPRLDGSLLEPQEFPLPPLHQPDRLLPLLGALLLTGRLNPP